jgi:hypothetical protein
MRVRFASLVVTPIFSLALLTLCAVATVAPRAMSAQTNTTGLSGVITDPTGAVVPQVAVEISNPATGLIKVVKSNAKGEYEFEQIAPGTYTVTISAPNFAPQTEQVELLVATPIKVNFKLTVGTTEVVDVATGIEAINSTDATLGKAFNSAQVQSLPYQANNILSLLSLQPGVLSIDGGALTGGLNTDTRTGIVNGARQDQTNVTLDGVDNNDQTNGYAFNGALRATRESVQEFRVTTTNANADAGRSSGGQVSLATRSGTNQIHASAYEYYRSGIGLSNNWFTKQAQLNTGKGNIPLKVLQHTYGASLGAPIIKDKLFFFGAYEGFKQASSQQVSQTVPSVFGGGGLITQNVVYAACPTSAACASSTIFKTLTPTDIATLDARASDPVCATQVCHAPAKNDAAIAYEKLFPAANSNVGGDGYNTGTYTFSSPVPLHQITNIAKIDYNINSHQSLFVRANLQSDNSATALQFLNNPAPQTIFGNNKGIAVGHIWSLGGSITNNFRYGYIRQGQANRGSASLPYVSFSAFSSITASGTSATSTVNLVTTNNFADDFTISKGRHTVQFGFNDRLLYNSRQFDSPLLSNATVSATLLATAAIAGKGTSLDPAVSNCADCGTVANNFRTFYNSAILGNTGVIQAAQTGSEYKVQNGSLVYAGDKVVPFHTFHSLEQEYYIQDQWKVTNRLTLTGGLRYTYLGVPYEINGQQIAPTIPLQTFLNLRTAAAAAGTTPYATPISFAAAGSANGAANFWTPQKGNLAPRFAFAYATADNRTSVRGGFALAYDHFGEGVIDDYQSTSSSLLSLSKINKFTYSDINTGPLFTDYHTLPPGTTVTPATLQLPYAPPNNPFTFDTSINSNLKTPYAETFNLSVQHEIVHGMTVTASYVGRLGRHALDKLDVAQPTNIYDPGSNQTYFQAVTAFDKLIDAGVNASTIAKSGYFQDLFPNFTFKSGGVTYTGAPAFYASIQSGDRGNETDTLYNADTGTTASPAGQSFRFFFPQTSSIFAQSSVGTSNYNAFQLSVRHVLKYGLEYDVNYTYGKSLDEGSSPERSSSNLLTNTFNPAGNYAPSDYDVRHNITANYTLPLPFGKGRPFLSNTNGLVDRLIGGWQLSGLVHYSTGFPFSANASGNYGTNFDTSSYFVQTGPVPTGGHHYIATGQYDTALNGVTPAQAFANLRYAYPGETGQRNNYRADGYLTMDDGMSKSFRLYKQSQFKLSAEVFNVLNDVRFNSITTNGASSKFGQYTGTLLVNPRQMQFSGKITF